MLYLVSFVLIFILAGYILLYRSVNNELISGKGAAVIVLISMTAYLLFPHLLNKLEIPSATLLLFLFVLSGMAVVLYIEEKRKPVLKFGLRFDASIGKLKNAVDRIDFAGKFHNVRKKAEAAIDFIVEKLETNVEHEEIKKVECPQIVKKEEENNSKYSSKHYSEINSRESGENMNINYLFNSTEDDISYVDFEKKSQADNDLFSFRHLTEAADVRETIVPENVVLEEEPLNQSVQALPEKEQNSETEEMAENAETEKIDASALSIEQCIDKAFELKEANKLIEAIDYYIEALDKKPDEQLMLWIVVDICSLYKQLGKDEMAKEMIQSYVESVGDSLDAQTKEEILKSVE